MKICELDIISRYDRAKLGKCAYMTIEEYRSWFEMQQSSGVRLNKYFKNIYQYIIELENPCLVETEEDTEIKYFPTEIEKISGLTVNLKKAFAEISLEMGYRVERKRYKKSLKYVTSPDDNFNLQRVSDVLKLIYAEHRDIDYIKSTLGLGYESIRKTHAKTIVELISGNSICENLQLHPDLIDWVHNVIESYKFHVEDEVVQIADSVDEQLFRALGLDFVNIGNTNVIFVIPRDTKRIYTKVGDALVSVLRESVSPLGRDEIYARIKSHYKMSDVEDFDDSLIENALLCDDLVASKDGLFYLRTKHLTTDMQKMARIIYNYGPISSIEAKRKFEELYHHSITTGFSALKKYGIKNIHGNVWQCSDKELKPIKEFVDEFAQEHRKFHYSELESKLKEEGYIITSSLRSYITNVCQVDNNDRTHFCHKLYVEDFPEFSWRRQNHAGLTNWILNKIRDLLETKEEVNIADIYTFIVKEAKETDYEKNIRYRTQRVIIENTGAGKPFLLRGEIITKNVAVYDSTDFTIIGLKGGKYPFFIQIRSIILHELKKSADGKILFVDALKLVNESIDEAQDRNTIIRAINNEHLPAINVTLKNIDGNLYVIKKGEDIATEPIFEIKSSVHTDSEAVVEEKTLEERPALTSRLILDWSELESAMKRELSFYKNWMSLEHIDFEKAVNKFIIFIKNAENCNLSRKFPQYIYEYWFARTDYYDRETYVSQITIFFEGLLSEIRYKKDGSRIRKTGLGDWMKEFPGMASIFTLPIHLAKGFERIYKDLYIKRNRIAHGEAVELSSTEIAKTISDYIALYVYTVAKYA